MVPVAEGNALFHPMGHCLQHGTEPRLKSRVSSPRDTISSGLNPISSCRSCARLSRHVLTDRQRSDQGRHEHRSTASRHQVFPQGVDHTTHA
jgi:hypothetical protein